MGSILISIFTFILLIVCGLMTVIILMQKPSANAGMGASLGGGAAESVFGGETANVLLKYTVRIAVVFFVLSFLLYMANLWVHRSILVQNESPLPGGSQMGIPATAPANTTTSTAPAAASGSAAAAATKAPASSAVPAAASGSAIAPKS